jgi:hypothetical protein
MAILASSGHQQRGSGRYAGDAAGDGAFAKCLFPGAHETQSKRMSPRAWAGLSMRNSGSLGLAGAARLVRHSREQACVFW